MTTIPRALQQYDPTDTNNHFCQKHMTVTSEVVDGKQKMYRRFVMRIRVKEI